MLGAGKQDNKSGLPLGSIHLIRQQHDVTCSLDCECVYSPVMRSFRRHKKREFPRGNSLPISHISACGLVHLVRKQSNVTCSLDCERKRSLVTRAVSGDAARKNLTSLGDVLLQRCNILVIYRLCALSTKHTNFSSSAHAARTSVSLSFRSVTSVKRHNLVPLSD